jgi:hypothetical protein
MRTFHTIAFPLGTKKGMDVIQPDDDVYLEYYSGKGFI